MSATSVSTASTSSKATNINAIDFGAAFLPEISGSDAHPDHARRHVGAVRSDAWRSAASAAITQNVGSRAGSRITPFRSRSIAGFRSGVSFGFNDTIGLSTHGQHGGAPAAQSRTARSALRADQAEADDALPDRRRSRHTMKANFVWDLPDLKSDQSALRVRWAHLINDWQFSGIWTAATGNCLHRSAPIVPERRRQHQPDGLARLRRARCASSATPGQGCSSDPYRQFNTAAFQGPLVGSVGLESGERLPARAASPSVLDLSIARNIRLGKGRNIQLRVDMFNAPNQARITGRNTTMNLAEPGTIRRTITNLPFDATRQPD